eukprot:m.177787 g.177787  ORF g.177787 m.177787 type:complete len:360 (+) comp14635_c1_seq2:619-1698(+)
MPALPQPPMVHHHPQSRYNTARVMAATRQPYFASPVVQHLQPAPAHVHGHVHAHAHGAHGKHQQGSTDRSNAPVCYHWQRGFCERGTACKFAHPLGELTENQQTVTPKRKDTCRHWQRGHCALGKACKFAHPTKPCSFFPNCSKSDTECQFRHIRNPAERERVRRGGGQHGQHGHHTATTGDASQPSSPKRSQQQSAVSPPTTRRMGSFGSTNAAQSPSRYFPSPMGVPQLPSDAADYFMAAGSDTFSASSPTGQPITPFAAAVAAVADHPLFSHRMRGEYGQQGIMYYDDSIWQADPPTKHPATSSAASSASEPWNTDDASESPSTPVHEAQVPDAVVACSPFDDKQFDLSILSLLDD